MMSRLSGFFLCYELWSVCSGVFFDKRFESFVIFESFGDLTYQSYSVGVNGDSGECWTLEII